MVTTKDIAKKAGLSSATVARAFASPQLVSEATRKKIFDTAAELHYTPNFAARSLRQSQSDLVGLIISDIRNPFFTQIGYALQEKLKERNLRLVVHFSNENPETEESGFESILSSRVNSLLFTPTSVNPIIPEKLEHYRVFGLQLFRKAYENIDSIIVDDELGTYEAVKRLISAGHRRILLLDGFALLATNRAAGYTRAMTEAGLTADESLIRSLRLDTDQTGEMVALLDALAPTAVIAVSERLCNQFLTAIKSTDKQIGRDVSAVFYDDSHLAQYLGITAVTHRKDEIIDTVSERLMDALSGQSGVSHTVLAPYLLERNSITKI